MARSTPDTARGFSLLEVLIALTLLVVAVGTLASLPVITTRANAAARAATIATLAAEEKMEQLRALAWGFDASGRPLSDTTTDLTVLPPAAGSGVGLTASPAGALMQNTPGYCDFLDAAGRWIAGAAAAPQAVFVRRWSVDPLASNPANALVLQVVVVRLHRGTGLLPPATPEEARLATLKTRKAG